MKMIEVTDEQYEFFMNISKEMHTQDNRITADPIFCVYEKDLRILPVGYGRTSGWFDNEGSLLTEADIKDVISEYKDDHSDSVLKDEDILLELEYQQFDYDIIDTPVSGQVYLTEKSAQKHIDRNHYHYKQPFVYVDSAWRNNEWQMIREILLSLTKGEQPCSSK